MGWKVGWKQWFAALLVTCAACDDASCETVANQLRACCAKGPAELRPDCERGANQLEQDGNADACGRTLDQGSFDRCAK